MIQSLHFILLHIKCSSIQHHIHTHIHIVLFAPRSLICSYKIVGLFMTEYVRVSHEFESLYLIFSFLFRYFILAFLISNGIIFRQLEAKLKSYKTSKKIYDISEYNPFLSFTYFRSNHFSILSHSFFAALFLFNACIAFFMSDCMLCTLYVSWGLMY